ncbi:zinc ribbon domain-containing protein [Paenibacillus sp. NRS-1782]|uniref:zinc ribbon domain-containing protein n=1 Tax=unclassified Paenibacillus TaxID=185978 RepID=UPI003D2866A6
MCFPRSAMYAFDFIGSRKERSRRVPSWLRMANQLIQFVTYKAESASRQVVQVNPIGTSQRCSNCGEIVKKSLAVRVHQCPCGYVADRDENAAINILKLALQNVS